MSLDNIVEDSYGQTFQATIMQSGTAKDISAYTTDLKFIFGTPSGSVKTSSASFATDGSNGVIQYTITDGDFDEPGVWSVQAYLEGASEIIRSTPRSFEVRNSLDS